MSMEDLTQKIESIENQIKEVNEGKLPEQPTSILEQFEDMLDLRQSKKGPT